MNLKKFANAYEPNPGSHRKNFTFTTDSGIVYVIYTLSGYRIIPGFNFSPHLIYVGFKPINENHISKNDIIEDRYDGKIMNTVFNFIIHILENKNAIIIFTSSDEEGRRKGRIKLFNILYIRHFINRLHKMDFVFPTLGTTSMVFRRDNDYCVSLCTLTDEEIIERVNSYYRR